MAEDRHDPYESTARWLEEAARRRTADSSARRGPAATLPPSAKPRRERTILGIAREVFMLAVLAAVYLNYYFMQVMIEIDSLPKMIVFYPVLQ
jgi:hypothetical protein